MTHLESVEVHRDGRSHWVAKAPAGTTVEWEAEIIRDKPNDMIAWCSLSGADVDNCGSCISNRRDGRGCLLRVKIDYTPGRQVWARHREALWRGARSSSSTTIWSVSSSSGKLGAPI
jgi:uncharacterized membrane protein